MMRTLFVFRRLCLLVALSAMAFQTLPAQTAYTLLSWDLGGKSGQASVSANFLAGGISGQDGSAVLRLGPGLKPAVWFNGNGLSSSGTYATLGEAITNQAYFSFVCSAQMPFSLKALSFVPLSQNRSRNFAFFSSHLGFEEDKALDIVSASGTGNVLQEIPLSGHDNITTAVEFRVYVYGVKEPYECFGLGDRASNQLFDLALSGYVVDQTPPSVPNGLAVSDIRTTYLKLSWNAASDNLGVTAYDVYVDGKLNNRTAVQSVMVTNLLPGKSYSFTVAARDAMGNTSAQSSAVLATTSTEVLSPNNIGINVSHFADWDGDHVFTDVMRLGRKWFKGQEWGAQPAALDAAGWPTEDANLCVWHGIDQMNGVYKIKCTGKVNTITAGWGKAEVSDLLYNSQTNTTTATLNYQSTDGAGLLLSFTGTNGGVSNVQMMRPLTPGSNVSYDFGTTFSTPFKEMLKKFSTIRFLDWEATNGSPDSLWENRIPQHYYMGSWGRNVASWETIIQLCNETGKDAWINIPVKANDAYVLALANLFKEKLNSELHVYVEFSNEVWNTSPGFSQSQTNYEAAVFEQASGNSSLDFDGSDNTYFWAWRRVAKRTVEISNLFRAVFGDNQMITRIRPVLMWQLGNGQSTAENQLQWLDYYASKTQKPIRYYIYGAGASGYYSPDLFSDHLSMENIWESETMSIERWAPIKEADAFYASAMGVRSLVYEGGPGLDNTGHSEEVKAQAVNDTRMTDAILDHHRVWNQYGGDLFCYYRSTGDPQWGFAPDIHHTQTPKYEAINQLIKADQLPVMLGSALPALWDGRAFDGANPSWWAPGKGEMSLNVAGNWLGYLFRSDEQAVQFYIEFAQADNATIEFVLDGAVVGSQVLVGAGQSTAIHAALKPGLHNLRVRIKQGGGLVVHKVQVGLAEAYLSASVQQLELPAAGNAPVRVDVLSNLSWSASSSENWLTLVHSSGQGNGPLEFSVLDNTSPQPRTADIILASGSLSHRITVTQLPGPTSIFVSGKGKIRPYPNPVKHQLLLELDGMPVRVSVTNLEGKLILSKTVSNNALSVEALKPGMYNLHLFLPSGLETYRFVNE